MVMNGRGKKKEGKKEERMPGKENESCSTRSPFSPSSSLFLLVSSLLSAGLMIWEAEETTDRTSQIDTHTHTHILQAFAFWRAHYLTTCAAVIADAGEA